MIDLPLTYQDIFRNRLSQDFIAAMNNNVEERSAEVIILMHEGELSQFGEKSSNFYYLIKNFCDVFYEFLLIKGMKRIKRNLSAC
jgi:hypothetical protein